VKNIAPVEVVEPILLKVLPFSIVNDPEPRKNALDLVAVIAQLLNVINFF
jgi:hypothetical protein